MVKPKIEKSVEKCGIVMPISDFDNCTASHWAEVLSILKRSIVGAGFEPNLVSDADEVGVIQKRIVQNLYENPIVVCDISGRNPNVMFELGMRLAFDKPTIVIKDDKTPFSFDTSPVEHLTYPRDLRFSKIEGFQTKLTEKIEHCRDGDDKDSFLKSFGSFKVAQLNVENATADTVILEELQAMRREIRMSRTLARMEDPRERKLRIGSYEAEDREKFIVPLSIEFDKISGNSEIARNKIPEIEKLPGVSEARITRLGNRNYELLVTFDDSYPKFMNDEAREKIVQMLEPIVSQQELKNLVK